MTIPPLLAWGIFAVFVVAMLFLDLGVFHRKAHAVRIREALLLCGLWVTLALLFNLGVYFWKGRDPALEFLAGYLLEYSLSVDNIFVFLLIFGYFNVSPKYQHRVLFWGILGALIMRAVLIGVGAALVSRFHWVLYLFGAFLLFTGVKMALFHGDEKVEPDQNPVVRLFRRWMPVTKDYREEHFFVRDSGRWCATPLFVVLLMVETTDLIFAFDSIPAIFGVTTDPFIIFTSNVFAIMGLRSLYFALAGLMDLFRFLKHGVAVVLVFVGAKLLVQDFYKIPIAAALGTIAGILALSVVLSVAIRPKGKAGA